MNLLKGFNELTTKIPVSCLRKFNYLCNQNEEDFNNIIVKSFAVTSNISKETKNAFINKKIETKDSEIPRDILNEWLTMIELPQQEKGVIIKKENHTYKIFEDKFEDKKVSIIVSDQKTTININGKEYKIRIITTSDHGPGCPGPGRNPCF